jgi:hypothetical protein
MNWWKNTFIALSIFGWSIAAEMPVHISTRDGD